jgi:hypothetical protein
MIFHIVCPTAEACTISWARLVFSLLIYVILVTERNDLDLGSGFLQGIFK